MPIYNNIDEFVKSLFITAEPTETSFIHNESFEKCALSVIPAKAGIHNELKILDSRLHGNDHLDYLWQNSKVSQCHWSLDVL